MQGCELALTECGMHLRDLAAPKFQWDQPMLPNGAQVPFTDSQIERSVSISSDAYQVCLFAGRRRIKYNLASALKKMPLHHQPELSLHPSCAFSRFLMASAQEYRHHDCLYALTPLHIATADCTVP